MTMHHPFRHSYREAEAIVEEVVHQLDDQGLIGGDEAAFRRGVIAGRIMGRKAMANEVHALLYPEEHPEGDPHHDPNHEFWANGLHQGTDAYEWSADTAPMIGDFVDRERK